MARRICSCIAPTCMRRWLSLVPELHPSSEQASLSTVQQDPDGVALKFADGDACDCRSGDRGRWCALARSRNSARGGKSAFHRKGRLSHHVSRQRSLETRRFRRRAPSGGAPDRHIVIYYVTRAQDEIYFVTSQPEDASWMTPESWSAKGSLEELRSAFSAFHPEVRAVLDACPDVHKWALLEREPLPTWRQGRVVLLGDACHPMTPYMAQGAASALEDAVVLSRCLGAFARRYRSLPWASTKRLASRARRRFRAPPARTPGCGRALIRAGSMAMTPGTNRSHRRRPSKRHQVLTRNDR